MSSSSSSSLGASQVNSFLYWINLSTGLSGGVIAGAIWQQNGFLREIGHKFPALNYITDYYANFRDNYYNYPGSPTYNGGYNSNSDNNYLYGGQQQPGEQGRPRVIVPGEEGGQPRAGAGGWGQGWPDPRMGGVGGPGPGPGQWPGPGYDPRCQYRSVIAVSGGNSVSSS